MREQIYQRLRPVLWRQRAIQLLRWTALGTLAGSALAIVAAGWGLAASRLEGLPGGPAARTLAPWLLAAGPVLGLLLGLFRLRGRLAAARAVDRHYQFKDRIATALAFLARPQRTPLHELQVADAAEHLDRVVPREVAPFQLPRVVAAAAVAAVAALGLLAIPIGSRSVEAGPALPLPGIHEIANEIREDLKDLDKLAEENPDEELDALLEQLREKAAELEQPGVDLREALAKLSEMQTALQQKQAQYNAGLVDGQLASLGEALMPAEALEAAGQSLQDAQFTEAAEKLEALEAPKVDPKEARAVEEKLKQVATEAGEVGLGQLGDAASQLADGLEDGSPSKIGKAIKGLARLARSHGQRHEINRILELQIDRLSECKGRCRSKVAIRTRTPSLSKNPTQKWGPGASGNIDGPRTNLGANRNLQEISGTPGDEGESQTETTHSPEGRQQAARGYKEAYRAAMKRAEAVLEGESIPLEHRQTIRDYFEKIRPQGAELDALRQAAQGE